MELAVSDMALCERLTPEFLQSRQAVLDHARLIVFDENLPQESIEWLAAHARVPLLADPVSTAKAEKLRPVLRSLDTIKPNRIEAELLSGVEIRDRASLERAADALLEKGLRRVFISLSAGVLRARMNEFHQ